MPCEKDENLEEGQMGAQKSKKLFLSVPKDALVEITENDSEGKEIAGSRIRSEEFILTNMGGERKCCPVDDVSKAEAAVIAFRALLKQKKL